jgi:hypothetical protein
MSARTIADQINHHTVALIEKWDPDQVHFAQRRLGMVNPKRDQLAALLRPSDELLVDGNLITTDGLGRLTNFLIGTASLVGFTATTTRIGVGDSTTAAAAADTDLGAAAGSTHRWFQVVDSAPTRVTTTVTNDTVQCVATFGINDGNFAWQEWAANLGTATVTSGNTVDASAGKCFFNHKVASMGTKVSGAIWTFTTKISWA